MYQKGYNIFLNKDHNPLPPLKALLWEGSYILRNKLYLNYNKHSLHYKSDNKSVIITFIDIMFKNILPYSIYLL